MLALILTTKLYIPALRDDDGVHSRLIERLKEGMCHKQINVGARHNQTHRRPKICGVFAAKWSGSCGSEL